MHSSVRISLKRNKSITNLANLGDDSDFFTGKSFSRIIQGSQQIIPSNSVFFLNFLKCHPAGKLCDDEFHGYSCPFDHGFPEMDFIVNNDTRKLLQSRSPFLIISQTVNNYKITLNNGQTNVLKDL